MKVRLVLSTTACGLAACLAACGVDGPAPQLVRIEPAHGYSDQPTRVALHAVGLLPDTNLDLDEHERTLQVGRFRAEVGDGNTWIALYDFLWRHSELLLATLPAGLPARLTAYPLVLHDPRGQSVILPGGFTSLGPDYALPSLEIESPQATAKLAPGTPFQVTATALDLAPGAIGELSWKIWANGVFLDQGSCPVAAPPEKSVCRFDAVVPDSLRTGDIYELSVRTIDRSAIGNRIERLLSYKLVDRPVVLSIAPRGGTVQGGTDVVIKGRAFYEGARALIGGQMLIPGGGIRIDEQTITGRVPAAAEGTAGTLDVSVASPTGDVSLRNGFTYLNAPMISSITPAAVPAPGGAPVTIRGLGFTPATRILFGPRVTAAVPLLMQAFTSFDEIQGRAPRGAGSSSVWVTDPELGTTRWVDEFTWLTSAAAAASPADVP